MNTPSKSVWRRFTSWEQQLSPAQICIVYAVLAGAWILLSDKALERLVSDPQLRSTLSVYKGWFFVVVSALLLFGLISRLSRRVRQSEAQLAHADRLASVGTMAASVAHEVNNPLTTIKVLIHTLRDRTPEDDPDRKDLDVTLDEIDKIRALILRFLQFARPGEPEWSQVKLEDVARRVINLVRPQATSRGITVGEHWDRHAGGIRADGSQLGQVVLNLLLNAVDAAPQGGKIDVSTAIGTDGDIVLRVWNSGSPLEPALAQRIFEPFYTTKAHGTGLGLAIASAIVEKHDGRIWARGLQTGGTEIKVALPRALLSE